MSENQEQEQERALLALREACSDYARLDDELTALSSQREQQRVHISELVALTGAQKFSGFGRVELTTPAVITSFDQKMLDALLEELEAAGDPLAIRMWTARRQTMRAGSLKISRER